MEGARPVRAPRGTDLNTLGWPQEAAYRMLHNNLDPEVAERPDDLVVYGGTGRAARTRSGEPTGMRFSTGVYTSARKKVCALAGAMARDSKG